jgi:hypothetical protein
MAPSGHNGFALEVYGGECFSARETLCAAIHGSCDLVGFEFGTGEPLKIETLC